MNIFHSNEPLRETIAFDRGLSDETKELFVLLSTCPEGQSAKMVNQFCQLLVRNYVWIDGFPQPVMPDRSKRAIRLRGLKALITGNE